MGEGEVARIRKQIALEYQAAWQGLHGLAIVSKHKFIIKRMETVANLHEKLKGVVGE